MKDHILKIEKYKLVVSLLTKIMDKKYPEALRYAKEFIRTQEAISKDEVIVYLAITHKKDIEEVEKDMKKISINS